jgi:HD superfamily phosphodiesterase
MRQLIQQYAKDLTAGRLACGYEHSYRVYHLARRIGEGMELDDEILHAACFLHDIEMSQDHPESSAEKVRTILQETGFTPGKIDRVYRAVLQHMPGGAPESVEGRLLHDANLLDTLGAIGLARLSIGSFFWYHYKTMEEVIALVRSWLEYSGRFFYPKSREMAEEKIRFTELAVKQLILELSL